MTISIEFDRQFPASQLSTLFGCVAYHSTLNNGKIVEPQKSDMSPIERLYCEFQFFLQDKPEFTVGRGGSHIWVANQDGDRYFAVLFRD